MTAVLTCLTEIYINWDWMNWNKNQTAKFFYINLQDFSLYKNLRKVSYKFYISLYRPFVTRVG